jgi:propanol-preferring alcohol dehydrogenase
MQAWVIESAGPIERRPLLQRERPLPVPAEGELRLQVLACGVCHTDLHVAEGDLPLRRGPVVPGHQIVGRVDAVGRGVDTWKVGDVGGVTWLASTCGSCEFCQEDRENLCEAAAFTGYDRDGGYAEYALARADFVTALPAGLSPFEAAPLLCAGIIGYRALRLAGIEPGQRLGLIGFGASAHLALQVALHWGCEVHVFTRGDHHRRQALALGAEWAGSLEMSHPANCHAQVLFAPAGKLVPECLPHLRPGGTLAINAVHLSDIPSFRYERLFRERVVRSVSHLRRQDASEFLELAAEAGIRADVSTFPFEHANEALLAVKESRIAGQAVLEIGERKGSS